MIDLTAYDSYVFDCDGVILDSNSIKTKAFFQAALPYGTTAAQTLVNFHVAHGGISRYEKFHHFLNEIIGGGSNEEIDVLVERYAAAVREGLRSCAITPGLEELRTATAQTNWLIVSGGDQEELRQIFADRNLDRLFNGGIFGSPDNKVEILTREKSRGTIKGKALFLGDSRYDHVAASHCGLDFVFISGWSEFAEYPEYCVEHNIFTVSRVADLNG